MARSTPNTNASVRSEINEAKPVTKLNPSFYSFDTYSSSKGRIAAGISPFERSVNYAIKETDEGIRKLFKEKLSEKIEITSKKIKEYDELRSKLLILYKEDYDNRRKQLRYEKANNNYYANYKRLREFEEGMKRFEESKPHPR